jgi:hypothetical protein
MVKKKKPPARKASDLSNKIPTGYGAVLEDIKGKIKAAQLRALFRRQSRTSLCLLGHWQNYP